jgi:hypothetical protein
MTGRKSRQATLRRVWRLVISDGVPGRALLVAALVGTLLNVINQGDAVLAGGGIHLGKALLTYLVPFVVSTHGAVMARLRVNP